MIYLNNFAIDEYLVTKKDWDAVRLWAKERGYDDLSVGRGKGKQPVGCISWYDAVKFCNALSELAGLKPVYYTFEGDIYKSQSIDLDESCIDKKADGYRLPNVAEWKYAARGGTTTEYFWGETEYPDCIPYVWEFRNDEITHEVGTKKPNPFGLYDIIGNVYEWCFDEKHNHFRTLMGASVALDAILKTDHECLVPADYTCYETGMRVVSSCPDAKNVCEICKLSGYWGTEEWPKPIYPDMSDEKIAQRFINVLSESEFSVELKTDIEGGNYQTAFKKFRNKKFLEFRDKYLIKDTAPSMLRSYDYLMKKDVFDIVFYKGNYEFDVYEGMPEIENIADMYSKTKDKKYLDLFLKIIRAYVVRQKAEHNVVSDEVMLEWNDTPTSWAWGNGFNPGKRSMRIMSSIAIISSALCEDEYDLFPAELFVELAVSLNTYGLYPSLKDGREKISNQIAHCAGWIMSISGMFPEFKYSELYENFAYERWLKGIDEILYPDGSAIEQALHYNFAPIESYFALVERFEDPEKFEPVKNKILNTARMLSAVTPPINDAPVSAYSACHNVAPNPNTKSFSDYISYLCYIERENISTYDIDRISEIIKNPDGEKPRFNSIYFPFGGTSVIRDGWGKNNRYMYFFAPRVGAGHSAEAICDIQIQAYGRFLLRTGGRFSYRQKQNMSDEDFKMMFEADEYIKSSYARNTVLVDGEGQARLKLTEQIRFKKYPDSIGYRWYESDNIVYTEGEYSDEYYSCGDVTHKREILFLKKTGIWIIVDRLKSEKHHTYTQTWHLSSDEAGDFFYVKSDEEKISWTMDGFGDKDIIFGENEIFTTQKNNANIFIRHMDDMKYSRVCGQKSPVRGWSSYETHRTFKYFPVHEIYCDFEGEGNTTVLTVIEASEDENSKINTLIRNNDIFEFEIEKEKVLIKKDNDGRVEIFNEENCWITLDANRDEYYEIINDEVCEFLKPTGMHWEERDTYAYPVYEYDKRKDKNNE